MFKAQLSAISFIKDSFVYITIKLLYSHMLQIMRYLKCQTIIDAVSCKKMKLIIRQSSCKFL